MRLLNKILAYIKSKKNFIILLILVILFMMAIMSYFKAKEAKLYSDLSKAFNEKEQEFTIVKNKLTDEISYQQKVIEYERELAKITQKELLEQLQKDLKIQQKDIKEALSIKYNTQNSGETKDVTVIIDSTIKDTLNTVYIYPTYNFNWSDSFLTAEVSVNNELAKLNYSYTDSLRIAGFIKRNGFLGLGKKDYMIDVKFENQKTNITSLSSVRFDKNPNLNWNIGLGIGYFYLPTQNKFAPGIGLTLNKTLIRF